jgi:hypothetical protein
MITFLTIVTVLGTIAFFLYALSAYDNKSIDKAEQKREKSLENRKIDPKKVYNKNWDPNITRPRVCPACGTLLKKEEYLYASISEYSNSEGKRQAHIYGCKYCYLGEVNSQGIDSSPKPVDDL